MLPPPVPFHRPNMTSAPNAKGKELEPQRRPPSNVGGMAQRTAERHAARLKAIQEAQEAQMREDEAARAAAATTFASTSATIPAAPQPAAATADLQDDEYHFPSDDDALYATVDLDGLDDGVGRPIDFEEGAGAATEDPSLSTTGGVGAVAAVDMPLRDIAPARPNWLQVNGNSGNGPRAPAAQQSSATNAAVAQVSASMSTSAGARPQTAHANAPQSAAHSRLANSSTSTGNGERTRTQSMGGGFSFPAAVSGVVSLRIYPVDLPADSSSSRSSNPAAGRLHRALMALVLRAISNGPRISCSTYILLILASSGADAYMRVCRGLQSARRAPQGMGLQNPPNGSGTSGQQLGNGAMREPFSPLEVGEGGDVKRVRRA